MKPLYRSQINFYEIVIYVVFYSILITYPIWSLADDTIVKQMVLFSTLVFCYVISCVFTNIYYFYEDRVEIVYPSRFSNKKMEFLYSDIKEVRYINVGGGKGTQPTIAFIYKGKSFKSILWPWNSFIHNRLEMRKDILVFLHNKNLPIIIKSQFKEDFEILELTKANGSWKDYDVVDGKVIKY